MNEIKEKLQLALEQIDEAQPLCPSPGCDILSNAAMNVDFALALLCTEQPPAGEYPDSEFTKIQRLAIESCEASYEGDEWLPIGLQRLAEACTRLDRSEASREALLTACRQAFNESHNPNVEKILEVAIAKEKEVRE